MAYYRGNESKVRLKKYRVTDQVCRNAAELLEWSLEPERSRSQILHVYAGA